MAEERATNGHPFWSYKYGVWPSAGQRYLNWRHRACRRLIRGKDILDVPCGEGLGLPYFRGARSIACLDYDAEAVDKASARGGNVVEAVCGNMADLPFEDERFDTVVSLEGLEHIDKRDGVKFLGEVWRVLRPSGEFLLSCPICVGGSHSGNTFHCHEWTEKDLRRTLAIGFDVQEIVYPASFSTVVWLRAHKRESARAGEGWQAAFAAQSKEAIDTAGCGVRSWIRSLLTERGCSLSAGQGPSLLPSCFGILAAECAGGILDKRENSEEFVEQLAEQQDEETGYFDPGVLRRRELTSHNATYIRMQATYFAIHALDALGAKPPYPVQFAERLCDRSYLRGWLDGGPWQNPWLHSNNAMFALTFLERRYEETGDDEALAAFDSILDYLDERQDAATGLWQPDDEPDVRNAVFAAYHFFPYYFWRGRRPKCVEQIIDSTLSIQEPDGLFLRSGGACEDLDGVHTLVMMNLVSDHRADDVRKGLERCFWRLLQLQNADGGFPNSVAPPPQKTRKRRIAERTGLARMLPERMRRRGIRRSPSWSYSGWKALSCPVGASDMWSAWFRPLALKLISERYPDSLPQWEGGEYRKIPGLGWHDAEAIAECAPRGDRASRAVVATA